MCKIKEGMKIHVYLTLPKGLGAKNFPTVLFIHGGPSALDVSTLLPEVTGSEKISGGGTFDAYRIVMKPSDEGSQSVL